MGVSLREGSVVLGASRESSLALTSMGGDSPTRGEPCFSGPIHKTRRRRSSPSTPPPSAWSERALTWGLRPCSKPWTTLEVPCVTLSFPTTRYSLDPASRPFLSLYIFCILTNISFQSLIARNRGKSRFLRE